VDTTEKHDKNSVPFLLATVAIGLLIIVTAAVLLRKPVATASPFDVTPAPAATAPATPGEAPAAPGDATNPK
jgi:hypothetical protein